jgi:Phage integrase family.
MVVSYPRNVRMRLHMEAKMDKQTREPEWVQRWNIWIAPRPSLPGVWRRKEGGFFVRGRVLDPRTGKMKEIKKVVVEVDERVAEKQDAFRVLSDEMRKVKAGGVQAATKTFFGDYAVSLFERKVAKGAIRSAKGREKWESTLRLHLIPRFGRVEMAKVSRVAIETWLEEAGRKVKAGNLSPHTPNTHLSILKVIMKAARKDLQLAQDPSEGIEPLDTSEWETFTEEEPNSLLDGEVPLFLAKMLELFPQHFAITALGFATGLRPSSLRPLRRNGATPDLLWDRAVLFVRRSQTRGEEVMNVTKQGTRYRIDLPEDLMTILRWHGVNLPAGPMGSSELLFPSETGGFRSMSTLDKPFRTVGTAIGLKKHVTPKGMRRTFQDLARRANVSDVVTREICGHATEAMQMHYSTVAPGEVRAAVAKIISMAGYKGLLEGHNAPWAA